MRAQVNFNNVRKGKPIHLSEDLPNDSGFGNKVILSRGTQGYVKSNGFEVGILKVEFVSYYHGNQQCEFNELSANKYLETDITYK